MSSSQPDPEKVTPSEAGGGQVQQDAPAPSTTAAVTAESPIPEGTAPGSEDGSKGNPEKGGEKADDKADDKVTPTVSARPEREATFKDYVRVFSYAKKFDYVLMVAAAIASIGAGTTLPLMNVLFGRLVNNFTSFDIFNHFLEALFAQSIHVLDSMPSGSAAGTITSTANTLQLGISEKLGTFLEFTSLIVTALIVAMTWSWELTLITSTVIFFLGLVIGVILPFIIKGTSKQTKAEAKATSVASEAFNSIRMVTACGAQERIGLRYSEWVHKAKQFGQSTTPLLAVQFGLIFFGIYAAFALSFWYGTTKMAAEGRVNDAGTIIIVLMSVMMMIFSIERVSAPLIAASKAMVAAAEFFVIIDAPRPNPGTLREPQVSATEDISFSGVTFAYPSRPHVKVLDDLSLTFPAGKVTAIVGPSGSGKSTIVGLIERWYNLKQGHVLAKTVAQDKTKENDKKKKKDGKDGKPKKKSSDGLEDDDNEETSPAPEETGDPIQLQGEVSTCGHNLDDINIKWWRSQIGLVQQEPFLFNDTIEKNVMYGLIGSEFENESEERKKELCREACAEAFADEFIDRLPDGYQTQVGDSGTKLSGGQRQRIAIARSIVKRPKILILDEATSAIDVRGERIVQAALEKASQNRTTITIAHRLSTIKSADKIIVMRNGKAVEQGTHESLLKDDKGVYYGLVNAQQLSLGEENDDSDVAEDSLEERLAREKSAALSENEQATMAPGWKKRGLFNSFGRLLGEQKSRWPVYGISVVAAMIAGAVVPLQAFLFAKLIAIFQNPTVDRYRSDGSFYSLMWLVLAVANGFGYFFLAYSAMQQYFQSLLYQKIGFFDEEPNSTGSLTARVAGDPKQLEELLGVNMAMVYTAVFGLLGALAIAFAHSWKLALVALCVTVPLGLGAGYFRFKYELDFEKMYAEVFAESSKWASESIGAFRTVSALTLEDVITSRYSTLLSHHVTKAYLKARFTTLIFALSDSISLACQALVFWYGGQLILRGEIDIVQFFVCYLAVINGAEAAGNGLSFGPNAAQAAAASNRILSIRDSVEKDLSNTKNAKSVPDAENGVEIEFRNVSFKYPTRNVNVLKELNLTIGKGKFVALVGASGSGKTSIISLLERFYDVAKGEIVFNGVPVTDVNVFEYRKLMSLVAQEATLFQGSIKDNILIGVDPTTVTEAELHEVCRDASIHDFIVSLPDGYDTDIGSKGVSLSGGQKQRVAIARALIRNPRVLLLDEATSSLDSDTEKLIQATFDRVSKGRTTVAVAHRLATIQNADLIYVLGEGKVLEQGSHAELLKKRGVYWHMCQSQALDR
uniref:Lipid A export ATP-binding/permease protein msbA n=2 Tax=Pyricularia oryzae TaxID=318829 RepID=L7JDC7_PYRO1